jgi:outer membrane receptor protein involved in Fe transport
MYVARCNPLGQTATSIAIMIVGLSSNPASGENTLPEITVTQPKQNPKQKSEHVSERNSRLNSKHRPVRSSTTTAIVSEAASNFVTRTEALNAAREKILPKIGISTYTFDKEAIESLPQGSNASVGNVLLRAPGVSQETALSFEGPVHVRLEHGFVQYRINGILLPDGATGFAQMLETGLISNLALLTGALPAQYGFRTAGIVDITTKSGLTPGGSVGIYGGSRQTFTPYFEYGGAVGTTDYFVTGRYFQSGEGIENPVASLNAVHDHTDQGKFFGYASKLLDDNARLSFISGASASRYQIPNIPGQVPPDGSLPVPGVSSFASSLLNERQVEQNFYNVAAFQTKSEDVDLQLSYFSRYSSVHFVPDPTGDLFFNNVASNVLRNSFLNGIQGDGAYRINDGHTLRTGFTVSAEQTQNNNSSIVLPTALGGACGFAEECTINENVPKLGWMFGLYVQDEWRITNQLTLNAGLRFDQIWQFVDANQFSPRLSLVYKPIEATTFHAGYARYFTPASQLLAAPTNLPLFQGTTLSPAITQADPVLPERAHYFDVGVVQKITSNLEVGLDAYYKIARDQIDVGQFGQALVLNEYNYEKGDNRGVEFKVKYQSGDLKAYGNLAWAQQFATNIVSQQFLFDPATLAFIENNKIFTDLSQAYTGSAGVSYLWSGTKFSTDIIYGSGLRSGFANTNHMPSYAQINLGVAREYKVPGAMPITVRFDIINVADTVYELRDGSGVGVFAPQFGPRRGYYLGVSQKL